VNATLHHELVVPENTAPVAWILMTHGIFGSGANWRSVARKLVQRLPRWGAVLVDLRAHGRSDSGDPPHTVDACAADLHALDRVLNEQGKPVRAALGHSFGGKVVLALRARMAHGVSTVRPADLLQTWMLDSSPSAHLDQLNDPENTVPQVLALLERLPSRYDRRDRFVEDVIGAGQTPALAQWLAMNLEAAETGGFRLRLDLPAIRALLVDYYAADLWRAVEDPAMPGELHVVAAGRSSSVSHADLERLAAHQAKTQLTAVHFIADAGHWLHIDAPDAVVELLAGALPSF
jgi:pimeloyl-ACP methyl ester carboxylesterase